MVNKDPKTENVKEDADKLKEDNKKSDKVKAFSEEELAAVVARVTDNLRGEYDEKAEQREIVFNDKLDKLAEAYSKKVVPLEAEANLKKLVPTVTAHTINTMEEGEDGELTPVIELVTDISMKTDIRYVDAAQRVIKKQEYLLKLINIKSGEKRDMEIHISQINELLENVEVELKKTEFEDSQNLKAVLYTVLWENGKEFNLTPSAIN